MSESSHERHWLGKAMLAAFGLAFTVGASYLLNQSIAVSLVLWAVFGSVGVFIAERFHLQLSAPLSALDQRLGRPRLIRTGRIKNQTTVPRVTEKGYLDFERGYLKATQAATKTLKAFTAEMNAQTPKLVTQTARTETIQGTSVETRLRVANETAALIDRHAARFERLEVTYRAQCEAMSMNLVDMLSTAPSSGNLGEFPNVLATAQEHTAGSRESMAGYRDAVIKTRKMRVSQPLNQACDRLILVLDRVIEDTDSTLKAIADARRVISKRWPKPPSSALSAPSTAGSRP
ncbi:MAG: hypothetical protein AUH40_03560 [Chloroflexi bacterium 13_1_40CM_65_17]|nr:MAG: hypothetical protein AUH40_03560 [Chloroflexi bacterium 13_1_40CM_65_17]